MAQGFFMFASPFTLRLVACALTALSIGSAMASPALSWNLSRDIYLAETQGSTSTNPVGAWTFMSVVGTTYTALNAGQTCSANVGSAMCWTPAVGQFPIIWTNDTTHLSPPSAMWDAALAHLHPGWPEAAGVRWTSPINGKVDILGRFSDVDPGLMNGSNGVSWRIVQNPGNVILQSGTAFDTTGIGDGDTFKVLGLSVSQGDTVEFIVDAKSGNIAHDTTDLDVLITSQLKGKK